MNLGDPISKKFTTARLFAQLTGIYPPPAGFAADTFWRDWGNVDDYKYDPKISRKEHMKSSGGVKQTDLSMTADITGKYSVTLDEFTMDLENLLALGSQGADAVQAGANITAEALTASSKKGRVYFTANQGISAVVVKFGGAAQVLGIDYQVDAGSGAITILNGGAIADASALTVDYTCAAITQHVITGYQQLVVLANLKLVEYDQFSSTVPRQVSTWNGQIYVTNWGDNKEDYTKVVVEALVFGSPIIKRRAD